MKNNFRDDIQGLRALAVMLVVVYHSGLLIFQGGYIGVDVFFVISGYLIAGSLIRELETTGTISFAAFYARRARRLLPAAVFVLLSVILVFRFYYSPLELKQFSSSAIATASYLSNFWFAHLATDYLAHNSNPNPLLHTWSLSVEEQFYFIWPLLLLAIYKIARSNKTNALVGGTIAVSVLSLIACVILTSHSQPWAFFIPFTRFWEFGLGALAAVYLQKRAAPQNLVANCGALFGFVLILLPAVEFSSSTTFPGAWAFIPVIGTCLLLLCVSKKATPVIFSIFANRVAKYIGDISYSLYLWHWPVFVLIGLLGYLHSVLWKVFGIALSIIFAIATYHLLENPMRFNSAFSKKVSRSFILAAILTVSAIAAGFGIREEAKIGLNDPVQKRLMELRTALPLIYDDDCHRSFFAIEPEPCEYGPAGAKETIVLFGDSHAAHWFPALHRIALEESSRLIVFTKSSCPSVDFEPFASHLGRQYEECTVWRKKVFEQLKQLQPSKLVLSNSYDYAKLGKISNERWQNALKSTIQKTQSAATTFVITDTPKLHFDAPNCLSRAFWQGKNPDILCSYKLSESVNDQISMTESGLIDRHSKVIRIDLTKEICDSDPCLVTQEPYVIFTDDNHLTVEFAKFLTPVLRRALKQ